MRKCKNTGCIYNIANRTDESGSCGNDGPEKCPIPKLKLNREEIKEVKNFYKKFFKENFGTKNKDIDKLFKYFEKGNWLNPSLSIDTGIPMLCAVSGDVDRLLRWLGHPLI